MGKDHDGYAIGNKDNSKRGRGKNAENLANEGASEKTGCLLWALLPGVGVAAFVAYRGAEWVASVIA